MEQKTNEEVCEFCSNSGFVRDLQYDDVVHNYVPVGLIECKHPNNYGDNPGHNEGN